MHILVDLDSTIADWDEGFDRRLDALGSPGRNIPRREQRTVFNLHAGLGPRQSGYVRRVMDEPGFYRDLRPIEGAVNALRALEREHEITLCSSPWNTNPTCNDDKKDWVTEYLGPEWADRLVLTKDKTMVRGDILIDDKPSVYGKYDPEWMHILFTAPYNEHIEGPRINNWSEWEEVIRWADLSVLAVGSKLAKTLWRTTLSERVGSSLA